MHDMSKITEGDIEQILAIGWFIKGVLYAENREDNESRSCLNETHLRAIEKASYLMTLKQNQDIEK